MVQGLRTGSRWFDPQLGQYSFRGLTIVIATIFIPLAPLSIVSTMVKVAIVFDEYFAEHWLIGLRETMYRCNSRRDITEILLKTALNTIQSMI